MLPLYYCVFNPIELICRQLKKRIRHRNNFQKFVELINKEVSNINKEDWQRKIEKIIKIKEEYVRIGY